MITSPTAVILALMLVVGAFVGGSVVTRANVVGAEEEHAVEVQVHSDHNNNHDHDHDHVPISVVAATDDDKPVPVHASHTTHRSRHHRVHTPPRKLLALQFITSL